MTRDVGQLTGRTFDLLVVGGGIYGLAVAYDAAQRGLSVALVERDDFGSGSSFNHLRTIHGGLRYLQSLDVRRARESVRERRTIARIAPQTVSPLPFVLPLGHSIARGRLAMRAAFLIDRLIAFDRNRGVPPTHRLPGGRVIDRAETVARFPGVTRRGLAGAAIWHDYLTTDPDRLTFSFAIGAAEHGAALANHVEAVAPLVDGRRVTGIRARDRIGGGELEIAARLTVNATGAAVDRLLQPLGIPTGIPLLKTMNLVTRREAAEAAVGGATRTGRNLFLVPWRGRAIFGTWESATLVSPDDLAPAADEVSAFTAELNDAFPALELTSADVTLVHRGIVPAVVGRGNRLALEGHEQVHDHASAGVEGIITVAGTKFTTARAVAEKIATRVLAKLGRAPVACRTAKVPLPGGDLADARLAIAEARRVYDQRLPTDAIPHLVAAYGSRYEDVLAACSSVPGGRERVAADSPVLGAQLAWAARHEMAMTLVDAVVRRTPLGALGYPGDAAAERAAAIVGAELGWPDVRKQREIEALKRFYE